MRMRRDEWNWAWRDDERDRENEAGPPEEERSLGATEEAVVKSLAALDERARIRLLLLYMPMPNPMPVADAGCPGPCPCPDKEEGCESNVCEAELIEKDEA